MCSGQLVFINSKSWPGPARVQVKTVPGHFRMILRIILKKEKRKKLQAPSVKLDSD